MTNKNYMEMLFVIDDYFEKEPIIIEWSNALKVRCLSTSGIMENDFEPYEEEYIGDYTIGVSQVEILNPSADDIVEIYENSIEISLKCIPQKISLENGTVLWKNPEGHYDNFSSEEDMIEALEGGGEAEFLYNEKKYSIKRTHKEEISIAECGNFESEIIYRTMNEAMDYPIGDKRLRNIISDMKITDKYCRRKNIFKWTSK